MAVYQEYLKNKEGNIFSPIVSTDSVYRAGGQFK